MNTAELMKPQINNIRTLPNKDLCKTLMLGVLEKCGYSVQDIFYNNSLFTLMKKESSGENYVIHFTFRNLDRISKKTISVPESTLIKLETLSSNKNSMPVIVTFMYAASGIKSTFINVNNVKSDCNEEVVYRVKGVGYFQSFDSIKKLMELDEMSKKVINSTVLKKIASIVL